MTRRIDTVFFDLDDTLHDDTRAFESAADEVASEIAAERGADGPALKAAYISEAQAFWQRLSTEQLSSKLIDVRVDLWAAALERTNLVGPGLALRCAERYNRYRKKYFELFPGALELLQQLRAEGKKLGIVTNGFSETHREKIDLLQLTNAVDGIFIADELRMLKPDPRIFVHACAELGGSPERSAMVGDRYDRDIQGALVGGLYTVWLNLRREALPAGAPPAHATCGDIREVGAILAAAQRS